MTHARFAEVQFLMNTAWDSRLSLRISSFETMPALKAMA